MMRFRFLDSAKNFISAWIVIVLGLTWATLTISSQTLAQSEPANWKQELTKLRENPKALRNYIEEVLRRRISSDMERNMRISGYSAADVQDVLQSTSFKQFTKKVLAKPQVKDMLDNALQVVMTPGLLEQAVEKQQLALQENQVQAYRDAIRQIAAFRRAEKTQPQKGSLGDWIEQWWKD